MTPKTFEDVAAEIRRLQDRLATLETRNLDMKKRRVINASPSKELHDYVIRQELLDAIRAETPEKAKRDTKVLKYNVSSPAVGTDIVDKHPVLILPPNRKAIPTRAGARLVTAPSGGDAQFRIDVIPVQILNYTTFELLEYDPVDLMQNPLVADTQYLTVTDGLKFGVFAQFNQTIQLADLFYFKLNCDAINGGAGLYLYLEMEIQ